MKNRLYRNDVLLTAIVFAVCIGRYFGIAHHRIHARSIEVTVDGEKIAEYSLEENGRHSLLDGRYILCVSDGCAYLEKSDCPDGICRGMKIDRGGGQIVCLPARLRIAPKNTEKKTDLRVG